MKKTNTSIKVLSYNIHKGFQSITKKRILAEIRQSILSTNADILCLQEVKGKDRYHQSAQYEAIADLSWPHFSYGKNAISSNGDHGNAILSKFPIISSENIDISTNRIEKRGILHAEIYMQEPNKKIHIFCTHLNLLARGRIKQSNLLIEKIKTKTKKNESIVLAGDFNDWTESLTTVFEKNLGLKESYLESSGSHSKTFPSWLPKLRIDRIYYRNFTIEQVFHLSGEPWRRLSDHLPIMTQLKL